MLKIIFLLVLILFLISGCISYSPEEFEKILEKKCARMSSFGFEKDGHNYTIDDIEVCVINNTGG